MEYIENIELEYEKLRKDENYIECFNNLAIKYLRLDPEYMRSIVEEARRICAEKEYILGYGYTSNELGWYYLDKLKYEEAEKYFLEGYKCFKKVSSEKALTKSYNSFLSLYYLKGEFALAVENGIKGIKLANKINDQFMLTALMQNTANIYFEYGYYETALEIYEDILINNRPIFEYNKVYIFLNISYIYCDLKNVEKARKCINLAKDIIEKNNILTSMAELNLFKGIVEVEEGNIKEAYKSFERSIEYSKKYEIEDVELSAQIRICTLLAKEGNKELVKERLLPILTRINNLKSVYFRLISDKLLSEIYFDLGEIGEAYNYLEKVYKLREKNSKLENRSWIMELKKDLVPNEAIMYKELYNQVGLISNIGRKIVSAVRFEKFYDSLYENITKIINADMISLALYNNKTNKLDYPIVLEGCKQKTSVLSASIEDKNNIHVYSFLKKKEIFMNDLKNEIKSYIPNYSLNEDKNISLMCIPVEIDNKVIGIIEVKKYEKDAYTFQDLTALKLLSEYLAVAIENANLFDNIKYLATHDGLTGILLRAEAIRLGEKELLEVKRNNKDISVMLFDIDHFKKINDTYGHVRGDHVIQAICDLINESIEDNIFGRYGGEEFLIILKNKNKDKALEFAEKIRKLVEDLEIKKDINDLPIRATISIGVYQFSRNDKNIYEGIKRADEALYNAKRSGRNRVMVAD